MINNIKISTLSGKIHIFNNLSSNITIKEFKHKIYNQHPYISKPFSIENINNLQIDLIYNGKKLNDDILLANLDLENNKDFLISINLFSKSLSIPHKKKNTLLDNYKLSPCNFSDDEDIFMDSMEWKENSSKDKELLLKKIYSKISIITEQLSDIQQDLALLK